MISKGNHVKFARFVLAISEEEKQNFDFQLCFVDRERYQKIVEDKDSRNTKRSTKVAKELFADYEKEKKLREPKVFLHL